MKKIHFLHIIILILLTHSSALAQVKKAIAYKGIYDEQPTTILLMPPINNTTNVDAKEFFHSTLTVPLVNKGYYVIPAFLSIEIMKRESAYDAELFLHSPLSKFGEIFGADAVMFTIIHKWVKILTVTNIEIEYILKSTKTNKVIFTRHGTVTYNAAISGTAGPYGALIDLAGTAVGATVDNHIQIARMCNAFVLGDIPRGKYQVQNLLESDELAGKQNFKVHLSPGLIN